ncbi:hypothetical protein K8R78_08885 [bacterium]|nr:hypothetical protein [bacterium]
MSVKILVPVIERLAEAVETIQSNYADMLAKMDNVATAVSGEPHGLIWIPTLVVAFVTLGMLVFVFLQNRQQNTIRLKDKILEQMSDAYSKINTYKIDIDDRLRFVKLQKKYTDIVDSLASMLIFCAYLPITYNHYFGYFVEEQEVSTDCDIVNKDNEYGDMVVKMNIEFKKIAGLPPELFISRYKSERSAFREIVNKVILSNAENSNKEISAECSNFLDKMKKSNTPGFPS